LRFLLDRENVDTAFQEQLFGAGVLSVKQFGALVKNQDELKTVLESEFTIAGEGLAKRVAVSRIVVAWEAARARATKAAEADAEFEIQRTPKQLLPNDFRAMKDAFEGKWWPLEPKKTPARVYVEKILHGLEKGELRAEALTEVVHYDEGDVDVLRAIGDPSGSLKAIRTSPTSPLPRDPEELRARITLLGTAWQLAAFQQTGCAVVQGLVPQLFTEYFDYLLGEFVLKLYGKDECGNTVGGPPWSLILSYEHEIRREAMRQVEKGTPLPLALRMAWRDPVTKDRFFTTPLSLKRSRATSTSSDNAPEKYARTEGGKAKGKGKGRNKKGKGKGGEKAGAKEWGCQSRTPDGKPICYKFNDEAEQCSKPKCTFLQVCGRCFRDHPMFRCPGIN